MTLLRRTRAALGVGVTGALCRPTTLVAIGVRAYPRRSSVMPPASLAFAAAVAACTGKDAEPRSVVRDSAGIRIVESSAPALDSGSAWTVSGLPVVEIGANEADAGHRLNNVEGALRLSDGRIVVANGASPALRWYDSTGRFLRGAGRYGQGPGEFDNGEGAIWIYAMWPLGGDSIATWEHFRRRMQVFDPQGRFVRAVVLELPPDMTRFVYPTMVGPSTDGFVMSQLQRRPRDEPIGVVRRDSALYIRYTADGKYAREIVRLPGFVRYVAEMRRPGLAGTFRTEIVPLFAPGYSAIPVGERLYYSSDDRYEIAVYDTTSRASMLIRRAAIRRPVTPEAIEGYRRWRYRMVGDNANLRREVDAWLEQAKMADSLPMIRTVSVDRVGALWVQEYTTRDAISARWSVFDPQGQWLTDVSVPMAWQLADIGRDYILTVERNEDDVEIVRMYALRRGPGR